MFSQTVDIIIVMKQNKRRVIS